MPLWFISPSSYVFTFFNYERDRKSPTPSIVVGRFIPLPAKLSPSVEGLILPWATRLPYHALRPLSIVTYVSASRGPVIRCGFSTMRWVMNAISPKACAKYTLLDVADLQWALAQRCERVLSWSSFVFEFPAPTILMIEYPYPLREDMIPDPIA